jgi:Flp pilus assembly protein TadD
MQVAKESRDGGDWNVVGLALIEARRLDQAAGVLRKLVEIFPHDEEISLNFAVAEMSRQDNPNGTCTVPERVDCLLSLVARDDQVLHKSALAELRGLVERNPQDSVHRLRYAFALMVIEDRDGAAREATILESVDDPSYSFHLNLGQIFYHCGDAVKGREHLELAIKYAIYERDRITARELLAERG